jgi:DNA-binding SARP family transcriptional activator
MGKLRLQLLGAFRLQSAAGEPVLFPTKKSKALLAYLALAGEHPHGRSLLANLFWEEASERQARESLRQALSLLRKTLLPFLAQPIVSEGDTIGLDASALHVDALEFMRLAEENHPEAQEQAANLYVGELLEGLNLHAPEFDRWLSAKRQSFHEKAVDVLNRLVAQHIASGNLGSAAYVATRLLTLDPLRESSHRALMELYGKQGRYAAALRQYQICADILARELNVEPEPKTTALYREIRALRNAPRGSVSKAAQSKRATEDVEEAKRQTTRQLERRQITILCCEISGIDALSADLDPEELVNIASQCRRHCAAAVERFGGHIEQFSGDRFTALFGFPKAHEHSAEEAVRAGLAVCAELRGLRPDAPQGLAAQIGIATSPVVAGELRDDQADAAPLALIGEAPRIANLLQTIAPRGAVLIAGRTKDLIKDLFTCSLFTTPVSANGAAPESFWQVLEEAHSATRFAALHRGDGLRFVGRENELGELLDLWQDAKRGEGRIAFVTGEPGIGKSRLAIELQKRIAPEPHSELLFQCSPFYTDSTLYPFIDELERAADLHSATGAEERLDKLAALLSSYAPASADITPLFAQLLSIPFEGRYPRLTLSPPQRRRKTLAALLDRAQSFAGHVPSLVVFEDCQWADASSLELLDLMADRIRTQPVLLLITSRPGFEPSWGGLAHVREVSLDRMTDSDARSLIQNVSGEQALPVGVVDQIVARTDGIPLFLEEMTQAVLESTSASQPESGNGLHSGAPSLPIPTTLQDLLTDRLDRLGETKQTAQIAAVIGREFSQELLRIVAGASADRVNDDLRRLVSSGLVFEQPSQSGRSFAFKHALVRDTAYQSLLKGRRQQLHAGIAGAIREAFPAMEQSHPELVARHLTDAGMIAPALGYWLKAGMQAFSRSANREAIAHLEHGLELVSALQGFAERQRWERQLLAVMGPAVMAVEGYAAAKSQRVFEKAWDLIDGECPPAERLRIVCGLWNLRSQQGELAAALPLAEEFLALSQASNLGVELGNCMMGINLSAMGDFEVAHRHLLEVVESFRRGTQTPAVIFGIDELILAHCYLARVLWSLGYPDKAAQTATAGFALARQGASSVSVALSFVARLFLNVQNPEAGGSEQLIKDAMAHAVEHELPPFQNWFAFWGAAIRLRQGHAAKALPVMQATIANADSKQNWLFRPFQLGCVAEAFLQLGDTQRALAAIDNAIDTAEATGEKQSEANLYRVKGEILSTLERPRDADDAFHTGFAIARRQKAPMEELRLALSMIRSQPVGSHADDARTVLATLYETFEEGFDWPDLRAARAVLGQSGKVTARRC